MRAASILAVLLAATLAGCAEDAPAAPAAPGADPSFDDTQPAAVTGFEHVAQLMDANGTPFRSAGGIWPYGDYVFGSGLGAGFFIADISDPEAPVLLWNTTSDALTGFARDADVVAHPDGRLTLTLATQNDGMHIYDVTDPSAPEFLERTVYEDESGPIPNHNVATIPGTTVVFNARSGGAARTNDVVDLTDPAHPAVLGTFGTHGCHDITFHGTFGEAGFRAYCAGIEETQIWNMEGFNASAADFGIDVLARIEFSEESPVVGNPAFGAPPVRTLHHLAMVNEAADVLIIGDEHNGGGSPGTCFAYDDTTDTSTPFGALWFYDISDETAPELLAWLSPPSELILGPDSRVDPDEATNQRNPLGIFSNSPSCTAHFGTLIPGEEKVAMAWYHAGVVLVDFSDPSAPEILDQIEGEGGNVWDARVHGGYVFTGDTGRGMDVLRLV